MIFIELPFFQKSISFTDKELVQVQEALLENPLLGDVIPGGRGLRKMRASLEGRGKQSGARVIYYWWSNRGWCYLVFAYAKNTQEDLSQQQLHRLAEAMQEVIRHEE